MKPANTRRGSLILLVMCFVAVLGIALASFLAFSTKSMQLSNRAYAKDVSTRLAEMGLERALRSYSFNTFSSWTLSGNTASETLTTGSSPRLPTFGASGITPSVNIKVYNYRASNKATIWNYYTAYAVDDFVWYQGVWYRCKVAASAGTAPSTPANWTASPEPWSATANYYLENIVVYNGSAYRCTKANTNTVPPNTSYWTSQSAASWSAATTYSADDVAIFGGVPYRCISGHTNQTPPNTTYWQSPPVIYSEGVVALNDSAGTTIKTQLRAFVAPAPLFPNALGATTLTTMASTGYVDSYNQPLTLNWDSMAAYVPGDVVRSGTTLYRCILSHTNQPTSNTTYWTSAPLGYSAVVAGGNTAGTAVSVTSAIIGGYVAAPSASTSPFSHQATFGSGSTVPSLTNSDGSVTAPHATATKVDLTRISRSPFIPQFDISGVTGATNLPATAGSGTYLNQGTVTLGTPGASTPSIYKITATYDGGTPYPGLDLYQTNHDLVIAGPVILNVSGMFRVYQGSVVINSGASLEVYFTGQLDIGYPTVAGAGIDNNTNDPSKLVIVGTSTGNTVGSHMIRTRRPFCGVVYMPNAYITMSNSTFSNHLYGAISAKNLNFQNTVNFHYDTSLRTAGAIGSFIDAPYMVSQLRELVSPSEKITLP